MVLAAAGLVVNASLAVFAARRLLLLSAAMGPHRRGGDHRPESLCVVVPARDEAAVLDRTLAAVADLRPAAANVRVVLVDDGSGDGTAEVMERWCRPRAGWQVVQLAERGGKGRALNAGIATADGCELVVTCDADAVPQRDSLVELVRPFADDRVAAAGALLWPANADASFVARYCALELWQHQLVTSAGKDRLGLNPPALGWLACYRRDALQAVGGFPTASLGEDVEVTNALTRAGWQTRFVPSACVASRVPERLPDYWHQHIRWSRGLFDAVPHGTARAVVAPHRRIETWLLATGYLDRIMLAGAAALAARGALRTSVPVAYLGLTAAEAVLALAKAGRARDSLGFLASAARMFPADVAASVAGAALQVTRRGRRWQSRGAGVAPPSR